MLNNLTIRARLILVISLLAVQLIVVALFGLAKLANANDVLRSMYDDRLIALSQLDQVVRMLNRNELAIAKAISDEPAQAAAKMKEVDENIANVGKVWGAYMATYLTAEEKKLADHFAQSRKEYLDGGLLPAVAAIRSGDVKRASEQLHGPMEKLFAPVRSGINDLIKLQTDVAKQEFEQNQHTYQLVRNGFIASLVVGLLLAAIVGLWVLRAITRPLDQAIEIAGAIASGDLTKSISVHSKNEMGRLMQALKDMNDSLVRIVVQVRSGTDAIATGSGQIAAGNMDLSSRTEQQASSLEETASSMEELTSTVKQNADNASQANKLAVSASEVASKGGVVVSQVVETMESINDSSKKIVDIIGVIDGIAFQTNILALNAAVEAARAGEQGRGFAVVASEVRNLAQRSANAAKEIKSLIQDSVEKVDTGSKLVDQAGATMSEIVNSIKQVSDIVSEITAASHEQTAGIEQINQAISQMDQVTQQNAALVEEAAAASDSMQKQATGLSETVAVFKVDGRHAMPTPTLSRKAIAPVKKSGMAKSGRPVARHRAPPVAKKVGAAGEDWEEF